MIARPRHIADLDLRPAVGISAHAESVPAGPFPHDTRLLVGIDAQGFPLTSLCRYARWRDPAGPATFTNLEFAPSPPGLRVGPWPGWRGIPDAPRITLTWGTVSRDAVVQWWGDEFDRGMLRALVWFPPGCSGVIGCTVADPRLNPRTITIMEDSLVRGTPHPVQLLPSIRGAHPRLLITREDIPILRSRARSHHHARWDLIQALVASPVIPAEVTSGSKVPPGRERPRPEDRAVLAAFAALIDPSKGSRDAALSAMRAFVAETRRPDFEPWGIDTQAGEMLFLLCLVYDWMYDLIPLDEREGIRSWLWGSAQRVREHVSPGRTDLAQAHYLGCGLGLLAFACVFQAEHPQADAWLAECRGSLDTILAMLPEDGFHPHGSNLWIYEYGFLLRWVEIIRVCTGDDLWHLPHWKNASAFRAATMSPDARSGITFGDPQFRVGGDAWCHYLIAARTGSGRAQATAELLVDGPHEGIDFRNVPVRRRVYEFLYDDPAVAGEGWTAGMDHFPDGGQVAVRTGGDGSGVFTFRAGPPLGASRYTAGERGGYGHADPCNGSFLWYAEGSLLVSGPGPVYRRDSLLHNIVTINGRGQIGDGTVWLPDFIPPGCLSPRPEIVRDGDVISASVDLARTYLPHLGVQRCHRSLLIDPVHERVVGVDAVACREPADIAWNLHSHAPFASAVRAGMTIGKAATAGKTLTVFLLAPAGGSVTTGPSDLVPAYPHDGARSYFLRWSHAGTSRTLVWCLSLAEEPVPPTVRVIDHVVDIQFTDGTHVFYDGAHVTEGIGI